jgi:site-specific DNA-methyltransferase (adenine-specific)
MGVKQIVYKRLNEIKPYPNNPRNNDNAVEAVANSIKKFNFQNPIIVDSEGVIVAGHTRYKAAQKLGLQTVPCLVADDLNEEQINAFRLADNKVGELATWDLDTLKVELDNIGEIDMSEFGFSLDGIGEEPQEVQEDDFDEEPPEEPKSKLGDIYQLGVHRLMCGDSTNAEQVAKLMDGAKADMVFTDPPYGMRLDTDYSSMVNRLDFAKEKNVKSGKKYDAVIGDNQDFKPELIETVTNNFNYCKEMFLWGADYYAELLKEKNKGSWFVWDKRLDDNADKMYGSCFELCWSKNKHKRDIARIKWAGIFGTEQEFDHKRHHPTQKPINLAMWFLERYSKTDNVIVDLYGGSGSTLIASERLNRKCYMMELDPKYVDVIIKRWEEYTGKKAVKIA